MGKKEQGIIKFQAKNMNCKNNPIIGPQGDLLPMYKYCLDFRNKRLGLAFYGVKLEGAIFQNKFHK